MKPESNQGTRKLATPFKKLVTKRPSTDRFARNSQPARTRVCGPLVRAMSMEKNQVFQSFNDALTQREWVSAEAQAKPLIGDGSLRRHARGVCCQSI